MSNQYGLRNLLIGMSVVAAVMLVIAYSLRNQGDHVAIAALTACFMVLVPFLMFAILYVMLLPLGIIDAMARESTSPAQSPFSTDRLPDQQIVPSDAEPSR